MQRKDPLILIAEDNEANLDVLTRRLHRNGYRTTAARNGHDAVREAIASNPDVILMDLEMPLASGFDALREIQAIPALTETPVIALTAHATVEIRRNCENAGFDAFMTKPVDIKDLVSLINRSLQRPFKPLLPEQSE